MKSICKEKDSEEPIVFCCYSKTAMLLAWTKFEGYFENYSWPCTFILPDIYRINPEG